MRKTGVALSICHNRRVAFLVTMGLLWLSCILAPVPALADNAVSDLPTSHWAIGSLRTLARVGLVDSKLLPGNEAVTVTRLEIALAVSQALGNLRASAPPSQQTAEELDLSRLITTYNSSRPRGRNLGPREIEALRMLVVDFGPELDILGITVRSTQDIGDGQYATIASSFVDLDTLMGSSVESGTTDTANNAQPPVAPSAADGSAANKLTPTKPAPGDEAASSGERRPDGNGGQAGSETTGGQVTSTNSAVTLGPGPGPGSAQPGADLVAIPTLGGETSRGLFSGASSVDEQVTLDSALTKNRVIAVDTEMNTKAGRVNALKRVFIVEPSLKVSSELPANPKAAPETGSVSVEAAVKVGEVKLGANLRNVSGLDSPLINPLDAQSKAGYDLSLKYGNVTLLTGYEKLKTASETQNLRLIGVNYSFSDLATLRAGYQFVDIDSVTPKAKANTVVGVDFNLSNSATLKADFQLQGPREWSGIFSGSEGQKASAGVEVRLPWNAKVTAGYELYRQSSAGSPQPVQQTASVGLGYNFMQNATLLLGYRLIDFGDGADAKNPQSDLTAGVSLRF